MKDTFRANIPSVIYNEISATENKRDYIYRAEVANLRFAGPNVTCRALLTKLEITKNGIRVVWQINSGNRPDKYIVYSGSLPTFDNSAYYGYALLQYASSIGLTLSQSFISQVFRPINLKALDVKRDLDQN